MPHPKPRRSRKGRWENYNRFRAAHRALDRERRLARATARAAAAATVSGFVASAPPKPALGKPWAVVRIDFASGRSTTIRTRLGPFGLTRSATRLAVWLRRELQYESAVG